MPAADMACSTIHFLLSKAPASTIGVLAQAVKELFHADNEMNAFAVVSDSGTLPEESAFFSSLGHPFPAVCIRTSTERPEALDKASFILAGIDGRSLLQAVEVAVELNRSGYHGTPVPDYTEENVSTKVVKIIQSYTSVVDKLVWRKS